MKRITLWLFALFASWQISAQTGTVIIGINDGTPNTTSSAPSPLQDYWKTQRIQMLYTASELSSAGLIAGDITSIGWVATSIGTSGLQEGYTISMKSTASTVLTTTFETGTTVVYGPTNFTPTATGNVNFTLTTPFTWDGTSNIIVQVCAGVSTGSYTQNVICLNATTSTNQTVYVTSDSATSPCTTATGTAINQRPLLVIVGNLASCLPPLNIVSSAITATTATVSWDAVTPAPLEGYEYVVSTSNAVPVISGTVTTALSASLIDLLAQTTYYVFVKAACSDSDSSSWNGPFAFTTACARITTYPHLEPFNTFLPNACWIKGDNGDLTAGPATFGSNSWVADGLGNVGTTGAFRYEIWLASANDWVISPEFTIPATGYELKFDAAATQYGSTNAPTTPWEADDKIEVLVSHNGFTDWTPIYTYDNTNQPATIATPNIIDLSAYAGETIRIAFRAFEGTANGSADIDFSIDNFQVRLTPSCSEPQALVSSNISATTADISWSQGTSVPSNGYQYVVSTSNVAPVGLGEASATTNATIADLLPQTMYYLFVRSDCDASGFSPWVGPLVFTTACAPITTYPHLEPFDTFLPNTCWLKGDNGDLTAGPATFGSNSWVADGLGNVGTTGAFRYEIWLASANDWVISPEFTIPATGYELKFDAAATQYGSTNAPTTPWEADDKIEVLVSHNGLTNWTPIYTYDNTNQPATTATPNTIDLSAYAGETIRIAFRAFEGTANGSADIDFSIDNFQVRLTPSCSEPQALAFSTVTGTTANISWNQGATAPSNGYQYVVSTSNVAPVGLGEASATTSTTVTDLLPQTMYYLFVRSDCDASGFSPWVGPVSFTTECSSLSLPFSEEFESITTGVPDCWSLAGTTTNPAYHFASFLNGNTGRGLRFNSYLNANDLTSELTTPTVDASAATSLRLKFYFKNPTGGNFEVLISSDGGASYSSLENNLNGVTAWTLKTYDITSAISNGIKVKFKGTSNYGNGDAYVYLDGVVIEEIPSSAPACATNVVATSHPTCGNFVNVISWDASTGADNYVITIGTTSGGNDIANNMDLDGALTYSFAGNPGTTYYYTIVPENVNGSATGCTEMSFVTNVNGCYCPSTPTSVDGSGITNVQIGTTDFPNTVSTAPVYNDHTATPVDMIQGINNNVNVSFDTDFGYDYHVVIWVDANDNYTFESSEIVYTGVSAIAATTTLDASFLLPTSATTGQHRMRIVASDVEQNPSDPCYSGNYAETADFIINVLPVPSCLPPSALSAANVGAEMADLGWTENGTASDWDIEWGIFGFTATGAATISNATNPQNISNLSPNTSYSFFVRANCGTGESDWSGPFSFTTTCVASDVPYTQDFESATTPALPSCTSQENVGSGNLWTTDSTGATYGFATNALRYRWNSASDANVWFYTQGINLIGGTAYTISYDYGGTGDTFPERLKVAYGTSASATAMVNAIDDHSSVVNDAPINNVVEFTPTTSGVYYFGFNAYSEADNFYLYVDNIVVDVQLANPTFDNANFTYYPNPVKNVLNLSYNQNISQVEVYNLVGQKMTSKSFDATTAQVDMSSYASGVYLVKVTSNNTTKTVRVIKE